MKKCVQGSFIQLALVIGGAVIILSGCASRPIVSAEVADVKNISFPDGQIDNFIRDLEKTGQGCVVHSVSEASPEVNTNALNAVVESLKNYVEKYEQGAAATLTLIGGDKSYNKQLYDQLWSRYNNAGLDINYRSVAPGDLSPPYLTLCPDDVSKIYLTDFGVDYISRFKSKDQGKTIIVQISNIATWSPPNPRYHDSRPDIEQNYSRGTAGRLYEEIEKKIK